MSHLLRSWFVAGLVLYCMPSVMLAQEDRACAQQSAPAADALPPSAASLVWLYPLLPAFEQAAADYDIPVDLLLVLARLGSGFENRGDAPTIEGGYGLMALRDNEWGGDSLVRAATLLGTDAASLKTDPILNVRGAAGVLDQDAQKLAIDRSKGADGWLPVVIQYAGLDAENSRFFAMEVYQWLQSGFSMTNTLGETFTVPPHKVGIDLASLASPGLLPVKGPNPTAAAPDYPSGTWDPAASCNYSTATTTKDTIVVHTIEGTAAGARSWFKNCNSNVSSHYVVSEAGQVWQMVLESQTAWHVGCYNSRSIGIEHEGYAASSSHPLTLYQASADLSRDICNGWAIPKEKRTVGPGIIGHVDVTNCCCGSHTDPGGGWDWNLYISLIAPSGDNAQFISSTIPSTLNTGQSVGVSITMKNTGTATWTAAAGYKLGAVNDSDPFIAGNRQLLSAGDSITPGQQKTFNFTMIAPSSPGGYITDWRMVHEGVSWFGDTHTVNVAVSGPNLPEFIVEARSGGQNTQWYSESGVWADADVTSTAAGCTAGIGSRYGSTYRSAAGQKAATFAPSFGAGAQYRVYTTWPAGTLRRSPILHRVSHAGGTTDINIDQTQNENQWIELGVFTFNAGLGGSVTISNQNIDASGSMYASAVRFVQIDFPPQFSAADFDEDGDVDLTDFAHMQLCYSGNAHLQPDPACASARLDQDDDVDSLDVGIFSACLSGAGAPAVAACGH